MPPYTINPRITTGRPNHPLNHKPAKRIIYRYNIDPPDHNAPEYRGTKNADRYAQARYDYVERSTWNDTEEGQAEREAQEKEKARRREAAKKTEKEEKKKLKKYGESEKGKGEGHRSLLGSSRREQIS